MANEFNKITLKLWSLLSKNVQFTSFFKLPTFLFQTQMNLKKKKHIFNDNFIVLPLVNYYAKTNLYWAAQRGILNTTQPLTLKKKNFFFQHSIFILMIKDKKSKNLSYRSLKKKCLIWKLKFVLLYFKQEVV